MPTSSKQPEYLEFPLGEHLAGARGDAPARGAGGSGEEPGRHGGVQYRFPRVHGPQRVDHLLAAGALQKIAGRARLQEAEYVAVIVIGAEDERGGARIGLLDLFGSLDAAEAWHDHVHQHHVRLDLLGHRHRLQTVGRLPDDGDVRLLLQEIAHPLPENPVIVDQQDRNRLQRSPAFA